MCNIELPTNVLKKLRECFKAGDLGHVEAFHLTRNEFEGSDGIEFALEIMQSQKKMMGFGYERNPISNDLDCQRLVDAIVSHPNISQCFLSGLCREERNGRDYLVNLLHKEGLKRVSFSNCGLDTEGQSALFDTIKLHPHLTYLALDDNKLNDIDAIHLADALRYNRTLDTLSLKGNEFTRLGEDILKKVVYDDSSLNAVADSNHVCTIMGLDSWQESSVCNANDCYYGRDGNGPKRSRARKIFHLLEERNQQGTNVYHMEAEMGGDSLKFAPLALAAIQMYGQQRKKREEWDDVAADFVTIEDAAELSITCELIRSWHIYFRPELISVSSP